MSKIGKLPIIIPAGTTVKVEAGLVTVTGSKGELTWHFPAAITINQANGVIEVTRGDDTKLSKSLHGLVRSKLANMVHGVTEGYTRVLEMFGVGYRAEVKDSDQLILHLGFSHPIQLTILPGVSITVVKNEITLTGIDKEMVGEMAARIRSLKKPEPYKGKGIRYQGEVVRRKAGKAAKTAA